MTDPNTALITNVATTYDLPIDLLTAQIQQLAEAEARADRLAQAKAAVDLATAVPSTPPQVPR